MDVVSVSALRVAPLVWQPRPSAWMMTVVAKATFSLTPGEASLADEQEAPNEDDDHWDDNPARSVRAPSDMSPGKPRPEIVLVGHAFAPGRVPASRVMARLVVGELDKSIEVYGDRWLGADGSIQEGARFLRMPLRYERAAGGPGTWNPIGIRPDAREPGGRRPMPNLQVPGNYVTSFDAPLEPAGFGPLAPTWPSRVEKLGRLAGSFAAARWRDRPLPEGFDLSYFNIAPPGQQVTVLRGNERIVLENLHPEHAVLATTLPGLHPAAFVENGRGPAKRVAMLADTLLIETDQALATLIWRASIPLEQPDEPGRVVIGLEGPGQEITWAELERSVGPLRITPAPAPQAAPTPAAEDSRSARRPREQEGTTVGMSIAAVKSSLPFAAGAPDTAAREPSAAPRIAGLPFQSAAPPSEPRASRPAGGLPFQSTPAPQAQAPAWTAPQAPASPAPAPAPPPPMASAPDVAPYRVPAPPLAPRSPEPAAAPAWVPPPAVAPPPLAQPRPISSANLPAQTPGLATTSGLMAGAAAAAATSGSPEAPSDRGAFSASNAAAAASTAWSLPKRDLRAMRADVEPMSDSRSGARELLALLWFDPESAPRIRRVERWKPVLDELERRPPDRAIDAHAAGKDPFDAEDMREIFEILARGAQSDARGMSESLNDAIQDDGKFLPPLVLVAGEIETPFDELESLKAAVAAASPVASPTDEALKAAIASAREIMQSAPPPPPSVAEAATARLRETFVREKKALPGDHLDAQMERLLLAGRHYQKREVLGGTFLRVLLWLPLDSNPLLAYLPVDLAKKLPMYRRTKARVIAEVHPAQDQYESQPHALRVLAFARAGAGRTGGQ